MPGVPAAANRRGRGRECGEEAFEMVVPAMKVREFTFSEVTKF